MGRRPLFQDSGKIFVTLALTAVPQKLCFKCTAETFAELLEREDIRPAPYVGRYKWVILDRVDALRTNELQEFIRQSYEMVAAKAPGKGRSRSIGSKKKATKKKSAAPHQRRKKR
jgi:predicted DNA-binding protein (MmcQ/YjbR family)